MPSSFRPKVGVVGAGRNGITIAHHIAGLGADVILLTSIAQRAAQLQKERRLKSVVPEIKKLHPRVTVTLDPVEMAQQCRLVMLTISDGYVERLVAAVGSALDGAHYVVHAIHNLYGRELARSSDLIARHSCVKQIGVIAGPAHMSDLAAGRPNTAVAASDFPGVSAAAARALTGNGFVVHTSSDIRGVELAAALHQVVLLAVGLADGLEIGGSTHSSLTTFGLDEIACVAQHFGAARETVYGLAGAARIVDALRRGEANYSFGRDMVARGTGAVLTADVPVEVKAVDVVLHLDDYAQDNGLWLPMVGALAGVLRGEIAAPVAVDRMFSAEPARLPEAS